MQFYKTNVMRYTETAHVLQPQTFTLQVILQLNLSTIFSTKHFPHRFQILLLQEV